MTRSPSDLLRLDDGELAELLATGAADDPDRVAAKGEVYRRFWPLAAVWAKRHCRRIGHGNRQPCPGDADGGCDRAFSPVRDHLLDDIAGRASAGGRRERRPKLVVWHRDRRVRPQEFSAWYSTLQKLGAAVEEAIRAWNSSQGLLVRPQPARSTLLAIAEVVARMTSDDLAPPALSRAAATFGLGKVDAEVGARIVRALWLDASHVGWFTTNGFEEDRVLALLRSGHSSLAPSDDSSTAVDSGLPEAGLEAGPVHPVVVSASTRTALVGVLDGAVRQASPAIAARIDDLRAARKILTMPDASAASTPGTVPIDRQDRAAPVGMEPLP